MQGAYVELVSPNGQKYRPSAPADVNGNAVMMTYGHAGAPAEKYKILVSKVIEDDIVYGPDDYGGQTQVVSFNRYKLVADLYADAEKTPHEIEVTKKKTQTTIDVGEAVRVKMSN